MVRCWNGWADEGRVPDPPAAARALLESAVGPGTRPTDAALEDVTSAVPPARVTDGPGISADPLDRVRHATGQSFPDWLALRSGRLTVPDAVARPGSDQEVRSLLDWAGKRSVVLVPYGGGTSVVGGLTPVPGDRAVVTVALDRLAGLHALDERSGLATFGAGTTGPALEAALRPHRLVLGHTPQSWERATVGGWVVTRSVGHQSLGVGRIEALFAGGTLEAPAGTLTLPPHPASAAGPDLRQLVLGSEGRFGVLTDVTLRVIAAPERDDVRAWFLPGWEAGVEAARALGRARLPASMIRLSSPAETKALFALAGSPRAERLARAWLRARRRPASDGPALLLVAAAGRRRLVAAALDEARVVVGPFGAVRAPATIGRRWLASRYRSAALRDGLWERGYGVDTVETAATWDQLAGLFSDLDAALRGALAADGEGTLAFGHLSSVYGSGASLYTTFVFRLARDPDQTLARWRRLKAAASETIVRNGATISHQHGVGRDHLPWLPVEKGQLGMATLEAVRRTLDPAGIMNPGVLLPEARG